MSKTQRIKGQRWEQEVASLLRSILDDERIRPLRQAGRYDGDAPDMVAGPLAIECKVGARPPSPVAILAQARARAGKVLIPVGIVKQDRQPPYVVMGLDDWQTLIWQWWRREGP